MKLEPWVAVKLFALIEFFLQIKINEFPIALGCDKLGLETEEFVECSDDGHSFFTSNIFVTSCQDPFSIFWNQVMMALLESLNIHEDNSNEYKVLFNLSKTLK
jgi:hypothetical protein